MRNLILLLIIPFLSFSQEKINLTGLILDSESSEKLSFASVSLVSNIDDKIIDGSISDIDGIFKIININENNFRLRIEYIGYDPIIINFNNLNKKKIIKINDNVFTDIGVFYLTKSSQKLDEIELIDEKPLSKPSSKPFKGTNIANMVLIQKKSNHPDEQEKVYNDRKACFFSGPSFVKMRVFHQRF